jgi:hypothetical protein
MGAWAEGPFDNDSAADFVADASQGSPGRDVTRVLEETIAQPVGGYIDVDLGCWAWVAAELVALSFGRGDCRGLPDAVMSVVTRLKPKEAQRLLALDAIARIGAQQTSEIAALRHEDAESGARFDERLADLRARLEVAATGPIRLPMPKKGDVIALPASEEGADWIAAQVITMREVAVFDGQFENDEAIEKAVASGAGRRIPAMVNALFRRGRVVTNAPVSRRFRGRKLYAISSEPLSEGYVLTTPTFSRWDEVSYDEALAHDLLHDHEPDEVRRVALGEDVAGRLLTLEERVAEWKERHARGFAERRDASGPGPFDDLRFLRFLLDQIGTGVSDWVAAQHAGALASTRKARAWRRGGGDFEVNERHAYAFVGVVALWRGTWPEGRWPESLADRFPEKPDETHFRLAEQAARIRVKQVLTPDCALHMLWDGVSTEAPTIGEIVASLDRALR